MRRIKSVFLTILPSIILGGLNAQDLRTIVDGNNRFAFQLYASIKDTNNLFCSPFSISTALAMTYAGARGKTEEQISKTLNFSPDQNTFHISYKSLLESIDGDSTSVILDLSNSLWAEQSCDFFNPFLNIVKTDYLSELNKVDFKSLDGGARAVEKINEWVKQKTRNKIKNTIGELDAGTRLILINAIYFKGKWQDEFPINDSREQLFKIENGRKVSAMFMHLKDSFSYYETPFIKAIRIPYKGKNISMLIFLPNGAFTIRQLEDSLSYSFYLNNIRFLKYEKVFLTLPKFNMTKTFDLSTMLSKMGMTDAFTDNADFSGMSDMKLKINKILHKAYIDVSEEGTEATTVTTVEIAVTSPEQFPFFSADHPFIFFIIDNATGCILFMGKIMNPN